MHPAPFLDQPLDRVLGERSAKPLVEGLGLHTVNALLLHLPRRYASFDEPTALTELVEGEHVTVVARVAEVRARPTRNGKHIVEAVVTDGSARLRLAFFAARKHVADHWTRQLAVGTLALFDGKVDSFRGQRQLSHPSFTTLEQDATDLDVVEAATRLFAIYPASARCSSEVVRKAMAVVLDQLQPSDVPDPLPPEVLAGHDFPGAAEALQLIHRPGSRELARLAQERFRYEEAFVLQIALARRRAQAEALPATPRPSSEGGLLAAFDARLPFELTAGQREVGEAVAADLAREHPMHRLLQGEVGSGKTVVALRAMLTVVDAGGQAALLAPTEVLAQQHHRSITAMLGGLAGSGMLPLDDPGLLAGDDGPADAQTKVVLLTGSMSTAARRQAMLDAASGEAGIVVGTHALLQDKVDFFDLGLVVVDEQHRFGVEQRDALRAKAIRTPHLLVMTATPIPRTVAMTVFGDLETSTLTEVPAGRQVVTTHVVPEEKQGWVDRAFGLVREQVDQGRQAFVVCPRIGVEGSELLEEALADVDEPDDARGESRRPPRAVVDVVLALREHPAMQGLRIEVLHGRLAPDDKDAVMAAVVAGEVDVLVATTVIEVGVDVPNASVMIVMDADRFGISQLHQLRGRIGRGAHPGTCLLFCGDDAKDRARDRLEKVAATSDGFALSHLDLETRREGDVLGAAQSGFRSSLRLLRVTRDGDVIADARERATALVAVDPELEQHPVLAEHLRLLLDPEREVFLERG